MLRLSWQPIRLSYFDCLALTAMWTQAWLKNAWYCPTVGVWFQSLLNRYEQFDKWLKVPPIVNFGILPACQLVAFFYPLFLQKEKVASRLK